MAPKRLSALEFHRGTVHPDGALLNPAHRWDPSRRPHFRKVYPDAEVIQLPEPRGELGVSVWEALAWEAMGEVRTRMTIDDLSVLLRYTNGITKRIKRPRWHSPIPFRAAACTGALFHIEVYAIIVGLESVPAGVYYYDPEPHSLVLVRKGDHRDWLAKVAAERESISCAQVSLVFTDVYWRNAIKYQAREYRHAWWDLGTMLANTLAVANALGQDPHLILGFVDLQLEEMLGIANDPEFPLAILHLSATQQEEAPGDRSGSPVRAGHQSGFQTSFPAIEAIHSTVGLKDIRDVEDWRTRARGSQMAGASGGYLRDRQVSGGDPADVLRTIRRRGSTRLFATAPITLRNLTTMLEVSTAPALGTDLGLTLGGQITRPYLLINNVDGLAAGSYRWEAGLAEIKREAPELNRGISSHLALDQELGGDAAASIYFLVDLERVVNELGDRGYRVAQLDAALAAGRVYLAAYALGIGATGLTFYDDAVADQFVTHGGDDEVMFLIAVGRPGY